MAWPWRREKRQQMTLEQLLRENTGAGNFADADLSPTPDTALRLSSVWACVRLLADTISTLPINTYRNDEEISSPPLLASPAAGWSFSEWTYSLMVSLLLRGNAYGFVTARSGPRLTPAQVELVNPDLMTVTVSPDGSVVYRYRGRVVDVGDLWHVKAFRYPGSPVGLSPIAYAAETIGLGLSTQRYGKAFFTDGATPSGVLSADESILSEDNIELLRAKLKMKVGRREPLIISGGTMTWTPLSVKPEESQFLETQQYNVSAIARVFGVPGEMVGAKSTDSLTYATIEGRGLDFLRYSVNPWLVRLEEAISRLLPRGQSVKFNPNALLRATSKERYEAHQIGLAAGFLTVNEVRALEDLPPLPGGDVRPQLQAVEGGAS